MTATDRKLLDFARRALRGLTDSQVFVGMYGDGPMTATRAAFLMQLGYSILYDKVIVIPVALGVTLPAKLEAVADAVVRYNPHDPATLQHGVTQVLTEMGAKLQ